MTHKKRMADTGTRQGAQPNFPGQHFIHKPGLLDDIVKLANLKASDCVLEFGAGKGALTTRLASQAGSVLAVEYDASLIPVLSNRTISYRNVTIIEQDILKFRLPKRDFVVVSNIPFAITTPIMRMLLDCPATGLQRGILVLEEGAARRFTSSHMKNAYVLCWRMWFDLRFLRSVSNMCFSPPPGVDAALIGIRRKPDPVIPYKSSATFGRFAQHALRVPDAPLESVLEPIFSPRQITQLRRNLGVDTEIPVSTVNEDQWGSIFLTMTRLVPHHRWPKGSHRPDRRR